MITTIKATFGVFLVLAMAIPVSASVITSPNSTYLSETTLINPTIYDGEFVSSVAVNSALTVSFSPGSLWRPSAPYPSWGTPGSSLLLPFSGGNFYNNLTINFSEDASTFGFDVESYPGMTKAEKFTVDFFSGQNGTGTLLDQVTTTLTGWGFFGVQDSAIGSVKISDPKDYTFLVSDMRVAPVPDPSTSLLLGSGLLGLGLVFRRRLVR
jgi:hypothetical protein